MATIKSICETIITYDSEKLTDILDSSIIDSSISLEDAIGRDDYILYKNEAGSLSIESITLDPDDDDSDILELVLSNDEIHGLIEMSGFLEEYIFLNDKVALIQSGTDDDGETYKYIRFDTASGFDTVYVSGTHAGVVSSSWYSKMQRAQAHFAIAIFVPVTRRIANEVSIYVNEGYGQSNMVPTGISEVNDFAESYRAKARKIIRNYYIKKSNDDNTTTAQSIREVSYTRFGE